jgi:hypothetical protein
MKRKCNLFTDISFENLHEVLLEVKRCRLFLKLQLVPAAFIAVDRHTVAQYAAEFPVTYYWVPVTDNMYIVCTLYSSINGTPLLRRQ